MPVGIFSKGILKTVPYLELFLEDKVILNPKIPDGLTAIAGWGFKPTAKKAIEKAKEWNLPYLALEDGFIRSLGLGFEEPPLSLIIDSVGIYYDATKPSFIENLLNSEGWETPYLFEQAKKLRSLIINYEISKYNNAKAIPKDFFERFKGKERILVIDQTKGDMSVILGYASEEDYERMLEEATQISKNSVVFVKIHPDVLKGKKKGYLTKVKPSDKIIIISEHYNPISILKNIDVVFTVSSQMGFEALLLEKEVHCYGIPFYAGWGLTKDRKSISRRRKKRTLIELLSAAYILYPKYINPIEKRLSSVFEVIEYIRLKKLCM